MAKDDTTPFTLAGQVRAWDPEMRVIEIGVARLEVASGVVVDAAVINHPVTVIGHRSKFSGGPWVVTQIHKHRSDF